MGFLSDLIDGPARVLCSVYGGHDFRRSGDVLVCEFCGKRVPVKENS